MEALQSLEEARRTGHATGPARMRGIASNEMCTFLMINISSLQLIPVNIIAYRSQYGSVNPAAIIAPAIIPTNRLITAIINVSIESTLEICFFSIPKTL